MRSSIRITDKKINDVARGLFVKWKIKRPSKIERFLDSISGSSTQSISNDSRILFEIDDVQIQVSSVSDRILIHSLEVNNSDISRQVDKTFRLSDYRSSDEFIREFRSVVKNEFQCIGDVST